MKIIVATVADAESILALQHLAYQSEAAIYDDYTIPPLTETLYERLGYRAYRQEPINGSLSLVFMEKVITGAPGPGYNGDQGR